MFKRIVAFLSAAVMVGCLAACGDKGKDTSATSSVFVVNKEITDSVSQGKLGNIKYGIGGSVDAIKSDFHYQDEDYWTNSADHHEQELEITEKSYYVRLDAGTARFFYLLDKADSGIGYIACLEDIYDFSINVSEAYDIERQLGNPDASGTASEEEKFFLRVSESDITYVSYNIDKYVLSFYFENNVLVATTLYDPEIWTTQKQS